MADTKTSALPAATTVGVNDLVPIVQNGGNFAARVSLLRGTVTGSTSNSTTITVTDPTYGGKGDGVILNDLTVSGGSTTITSAVGPFTSTAVDAGKLVYWRTGAGTTASGVIASVQSSTSATLTAGASTGSTADGGPNANGCFGTDNTAALNAAFVAAGARQVGAGQNRLEHAAALRVHLPGGVYVTKPLTTMTARGVMVTGDGYFSTYVVTGDAGSIFTLGAFNNNPSYVYNSGYNQEAWTFRDMQFMNPCQRAGSTENSRITTAIQDNGNGNTRIENCIFMGLKYGFAGAYGSDFSDIRGSYFYLCDVGAYFGPGCQQIGVYKTDFSYCREGFVSEGAEHWHLGDACSFEDNYISSITIDGTNGSATRFGLPRAAPGSYYTGVFVVDGNTWFETNSGNSSRLAARQIFVTGDGDYGRTFQRLVVRDAMITAGGTQVSGGNNTFVEIATNQSSGAVDGQVIIENIAVGGNYLNSIVRSSGNAQAKVHLRDVSKENSATALTQGSVALRTMTLDGQITGYTVSA